MKPNAIASMFLRRRKRSGRSRETVTGRGFTLSCTEEIAVFQAFSRVIREAGKRFVVMDTPLPDTRCCCWMRPGLITERLPKNGE